METIKSVGIKELKNKLSAFVREVHAGTLILITDHHRVVAQLSRPFAQKAAYQHPLLEQWVQAGVLQLPQQKKGLLPTSFVQVSEGTAKRILDEERT